MAELNDRDQKAEFRMRHVLDGWTYINRGETPWFAMVPKGVKPKQNKLEQPLLRRPAARNAPVPDGKDVESADYENVEDLKHMLSARWQKARRAIKVGSVADALGAQYPNIPAKGGLLRQNIELFMTALRQDVEMVCLDNYDSFPEVDDTAGNRTRGANYWIQNGAQGDLEVPSQFRTPTASILSGKATVDAITEQDFRNLLVGIYNATEKAADLDLFCRLELKSQMADWTKTGEVSSTTVPLRRFTQDATSGKIKLSVSIYEGEGIIRVHPHFHLPSGSGSAFVWGYFFNMDFWNFHAVDTPTWKPHEDKDGGPRGHMSKTFFNMCRNPLMHGKATK